MMRGRSFETVDGCLSFDHEVLDRMLEDVARMVADGELEHAENQFHDFHDALLRHMGLEEELLFPLFENRAGMQDGPILSMKREHQAVRRLLAALGGAL